MNKSVSPHPVALGTSEHFTFVERKTGLPTRRGHE